MNPTSSWKGLIRRMADILQGMRQYRMCVDDEVYCIAYGSNLDEGQMKSRCPVAEVYGTSIIRGYRLLFKHSLTGAYATIEQDANCEVPVVIYRITREDESRLDKCEGFPRYYRKKEFFLPVWCLNGKRRKYRQICFAYIMHESRELGMPSEKYFHKIENAYGRWGFDFEVLFKGLDDSIGKKQTKEWLERYYQGGESKWAKGTT